MTLQKLELQLSPNAIQVEEGEQQPNVSYQFAADGAVIVEVLPGDQVERSAVRMLIRYACARQ